MGVLGTGLQPSHVPSKHFLNQATCSPEPLLVCGLLFFEGGIQAESCCVAQAGLEHRVALKLRTL